MKAAHYLQKAEEMRRLASRAEGDDTCGDYLEIAKAWDDLARNALAAEAPRADVESGQATRDDPETSAQV